jgi:hypothetical protein
VDDLPTTPYFVEPLFAIYFPSIQFQQIVFMTHPVDKVGSLLQSAQLTLQQLALSASSKAMLAKVRKLVPPMLEKFHKGEHGLATVW